MRPSPSSRAALTPSRLLVLALWAAATVACSSGETGVAAEHVAAPAVPASTPTAAPTPDVDLASRAQQAVADNRLYAPAGNNAIELYLAQRESAPAGDASAEAALIELQPYAMMAAEQAIAGADFTEAERLIALMVRIDATAPSLARLRDDLAVAREAQVAAQTAAEAAEAAEAARPPVTPPPTPAVATTPRPTTAPPPRAPATAERTSPPAATPARTAPASPAPSPPPSRPAATPAPAGRPTAAPGPLVPISTPFPPFPSEAIARGRSMGSVTVRFTVRANGRVGDIRVVEARPEGLFERTVIDTLGEWRFEPSAAERTETRTFNFRN